MRLRPQITIGELERNGAIVEIQDGNHGEKHPVAADYVPTGIPFLMASDINDGIVDLIGCKFITKQQADSLRIGFAQSGDVLLTHKGTVGNVAVLPHVERFAMLTPQVTYYRVDETQLSNCYLRYAFAAPDFQARLKSVSAQSTRPYIGITAQRNLEITWVERPIQERIAFILSAYDDLIENNTRRIKILEDMAQMIYREWFVNFRFPGHENVRMMDSELGPIPEGWNVQNIADVCLSIEDGDWIETKDQGGQDFRLLQVSNIGVNTFVETNNFRFVTKETFARLRCREIAPGDILVSRMPKPTGRAWLVRKLPWKAITAVDVAIVKADPHKMSSFVLAHHFNSSEQLANVEKRTTGTTRPRISRRDFSSILVVVPQLQLQQRFERHIMDTWSMVEILREATRVLAVTRDFLLPKLISGEIPVEAADENASELIERIA